LEAWKAQHVVSRELAKRLIQEQFPSLKPVQIEELGKGFDNTVYKVNEQYVFRFPRKKVAVEFLEKEKELLPELAKVLPLSIPDPVMIGEGDHGYPWIFLGYDIVLGQTPESLSQHERDQSAESVAYFFKELHQFSVSEAMRLGVRKDELHRPDIFNRKPKLKENLETAYEQGLLERGGWLDSFLEELEPIEYEPFVCLTHGDFHIRNVLIDDDKKISGVIDWGDSHIGHPSVDLSFLFSYFSKKGRERFFQIYGEVDEQTLTLAKFISIYVSVILLLYGQEFGDDTLVQEAQHSLELAVT